MKSSSASKTRCGLRAYSPAARNHRASDGNWEDWTSIDGCVAAASKSKWVRIQTGDHLTPFYSEEALAIQQRFFDHFLKGEKNGMGKRAASVFAEQAAGWYLLERGIRVAAPGYALRSLIPGLQPVVLRARPPINSRWIRSRKTNRTIELRLQTGLLVAGWGRPSPFVVCLVCQNRAQCSSGYYSYVLGCVLGNGARPRARSF